MYLVGAFFRIIISKMIVWFHLMVTGQGDFFSSRVEVF